jgi:2-phospho-L-lactate guanylyltransferase
MRGFRGAKGRLSDALDPSSREALAETLLRTVMAAAPPLAVLVVTSDPDVVRTATHLGASVVDDPGSLDAAVTAGVETAGIVGHQRAVVAHGDLAFPTDLAELGGPSITGVVLVPDRRLDGTNVISLPIGIGFRFHYGPGSFDRHRAEARGLGIEPTVIADSRLGWDVDLPEDLITPSEWGPPPWETVDD